MTEQELQSRFNLTRSLLLSILTGALAALIGFGITSVISQAQFSNIIFQHIYEASSILGGGLIAVYLFELVLGKDVYDDNEIGLFLIIFTALTLFPLPLIGDAIAVPFYPVYNLPYPFAVQYGILAFIEASIGIMLTVLLEKYTEVI